MYTETEEEVLTLEKIPKKEKAVKVSNNGHNGREDLPVRKRQRTQINGELKIFLVDDNKFFLNTLYYFLSDSFSSQIQIKKFATAEDCINAIEEKPSIIVLDYMLDTETSGNMNGLAAMKKINKLSPQTFVIILSAQDDITIALKTLKEGAYDYLSKSETAFIRLKTIITNILETISHNREQKKEDVIAKRINLLIILILIALFIINRIIN